MGAKIRFETIHVDGFIIDLGTNLIPESTPICFIDRDGVVLDEVTREDKTYGSLRDFKDFRYCEGSRQTLIKFVSHHVPVVIVSNQSDVSNKKISLDFLTAVNAKILKDTRINAICSCPHATLADCSCRKPKTGIIKYFEREYFTPLNRSLIIGDRFTDMQMGIPDGLRQIHITQNKLCRDTNHTHFDTLNQSEEFVLQMYHEKLI